MVTTAVCMTTARSCTIQGAISSNGQDTIGPTNASAQIGQRMALSAGDIAATNSLCLEQPKELPKDPPKEFSKDRRKEFPKDPPKELGGPSDLAAWQRRLRRLSSLPFSSASHEF